MAHPAIQHHDDEPTTMRAKRRGFDVVEIPEVVDEPAPITLRSSRADDVADVTRSLPPPSVEVVEQSGLRAAVTRMSTGGDDVDEWLDESFLEEDDAPDTLRQRSDDAPITLRSAPTSV